MILSKEEENDAEVRREDQDAINEFGRLNARLDEVKRQVESMKVRIIALLMVFALYIKYLCLIILLYTICAGINSFRKQWRKLMMPPQNS